MSLTVLIVLILGTTLVSLFHTHSVVTGYIYPIDDIQMRPADSKSNNEGVILVLSQGEWYGVCHFRTNERFGNTWGEKESNAACKQLGYTGGWIIEVRLKASEFADKFVADFDCSSGETDLNNCKGGTGITDSCEQSRPAGVYCYSNFDVTLAGGVAPNSGRVEVKYDDVWASVCYDSEQYVSKQWSFTNAQVVCKELGFPGTMFTRKGGLGQGMHKSSIYGYRCKGLEYSSLHECQHDPPDILPETYNGPTCRKDNEAVVVCAVPGYIGCFQTNSNTERTSHELRLEANNMTIGMCRHHCRNIGVQLACLYNDRKCLCRDSITDHTRDRDFRCKTKCDGEDLEACEGPETMAVYNVNDGICNDSLNGSDVFYYGDIFSNFSCTFGGHLEGAKSIQCMMNTSNGDMQWSEDFPKCKGQLLELDTYNLAPVIGASGGALLIVITVVLITCKGVAKSRRKPTTDNVTDQIASTDFVRDAGYEDVNDTNKMYLTPLPGTGVHQESTSNHAPTYDEVFDASVPGIDANKGFNYPKYATHIDVNYPKYATHIDDLNACKMVRSSTEVQNNSRNASMPGTDANSSGLNYPEYERHIDDLSNARTMLPSAPKAPNTPGNGSEDGTFHGARVACHTYLQFIEDQHDN